MATTKPSIDSFHHRPEMRCDCGSLLARLVGGRVEVKCRRCKRTVLLTVEPERGDRAASR